MKRLSIFIITLILLSGCTTPAIDERYCQAKLKTNGATSTKSSKNAYKTCMATYNRTKNNEPSFLESLIETVIDEVITH